MFKGRSIQSGIHQDDFEGTVNFDDVFVEIYYINGYAISQGIKYTLTLSYDSVGYDENFRVYEINSSGSCVRFVGDYTDSEITDTITHPDAVGIGLVCNDNPTGTYSISYSLSYIDNIINNPIDYLRHIIEFQNWSELGGSQSWGKEKATLNMVKTSGNGSFNDSLLDDIKSLEISHQIHSYNDAWTDAIKQSVAERFFLLVYQDQQGYECVKHLLSKETPTLSIGYGDLKKECYIVQFQRQYIYSTVNIKYAYDYATDKFTKQLLVDHTWESTFDTSYVSGFYGTDGQTIWEALHLAWLKTRKIAPMPNNLSDMYMVNNYETAMFCLENMVQMYDTSRTTLTVGYENGCEIDVGTHFMLSLPHHTNGNSVECVVLLSDHNKFENECTFEVLILDEIEL